MESMVQFLLSKWPNSSKHPYCTVWNMAWCIEITENIFFLKSERFEYLSLNSAPHIPWTLSQAFLLISGCWVSNGNMFIYLLTEFSATNINYYSCTIVLKCWQWLHHFDATHKDKYDNVIDSWGIIVPGYCSHLTVGLCVTHIVHPHP